jgi:hypothetical protein
MITDQDVDVFLEHHGVKGMHWGQRRKEELRKHRERLVRVSKGTATKQDKGNIRARRMGMASLGVAGGIAAIALGAAFMKHHNAVRIREIHMKADQLARVRRAVDKAMWQNPVHKNQAANIREFVKRLN